MSWTLNRRKLLTGAGSMLALPLLAKFSSKEALADGTSDPRRLIMIHMPDGTQTRAANPTWFSAPDGATLNASNAPIPLQPFGGNLQDITILKYLTQSAFYTILNAGSGDHQTSSFFTGQTRDQINSGSSTVRGDSFDVAYAKTTPQKRIVYLANSQQQINDNSGNFRYELSMNNTGGQYAQNVVPERSPVSFYNTYFKNLMSTPGAPKIDFVRNPAILGLPNAELKELQSKLGKGDQATLAAYLQGLTDLKANMTATGSAQCTAPNMPDATATGNEVSGTDYFARMLAFNKLIAVGFQCDLFRSVSLSFGSEVGYETHYGNGGTGSYPTSLIYNGGVPGNYDDHSISHQSADLAATAGNLGNGLAINMTRDRLHMYLVVDLINQLIAIKDPSGSRVLDNTCIFGAFSTYDGEHRPDLTLGQPAFVAGGKNFMTPGRCLNASQWDLNDIYFTFSQFLGMGLQNWYPIKQINLPYGKYTGRMSGSTRVPL